MESATDPYGTTPMFDHPPSGGLIGRHEEAVRAMIDDLTRRTPLTPADRLKATALLAAAKAVDVAERAADIDRTSSSARALSLTTRTLLATAKASGLIEPQEGAPDGFIALLAGMDAEGAEEGPGAPDLP